MKLANITQTAARRLREYDRREAGTPRVEFDQEQAYALQAEVCRLREQRGEALAGYKVGCTTPATQRQLGIDCPVYGRLFDSECWLSGASLPAERFVGLAIEGELAVRLGRDLAAEPVDSAVLDAIDAAFAVIELHNFVFVDEQPTAAALIASNAMHAGFVFAADAASGLPAGPATLRVEIDDVEVVAVTGMELVRTVTASLKWLARELARRGGRLRTGQTVLCGSVGDLVSVPRGGRIRVATDRFGSVACTIERARRAERS